MSEATPVTADKDKAEGSRSPWFSGGREFLVSRQNTETGYHGAWKGELVRVKFDIRRE